MFKGCKSNILICPLSTKIENYKRDLIQQLRIDRGLKETSEELAMQLRSISRDYLVKRIGKINPEEFSKIRKSLQDLLILD